MAIISGNLETRDGESSVEALIRIRDELNMSRNLIQELITREIMNYFKELALKDGKLKVLQDIMVKFRLKSENSITACKKVIKDTIFIDIMDFMTGNYDKKFKSRKELAKHLRKTKNYFPVKLAREQYWDCLLQNIVIKH